MKREGADTNVALFPWREGKAEAQGGQHRCPHRCLCHCHCQKGQLSTLLAQSKEVKIPSVSIPGLSPAPQVFLPPVALPWFWPYRAKYRALREPLSLPGEGLLNSTVSPPERSICNFCQGLVNARSLEERLLRHMILNEKLSFPLSLFQIQPLHSMGRGSTDNIYFMGDCHCL